MTKLDILKKLNLIKHVDTNGLNGDKYYKTNRKNPLFWVIYALMWVVFFIPFIIYGTVTGIMLIFDVENDDFLTLFDITEQGKGRDKLSDLLPE